MSEHNLPWRWSSEWETKELPKHRDDYNADKYADLCLYDATGKPVIDLRVDHHEFEFSGGILKKHRELIVRAANSHEELLALLKESAERLNEEVELLAVTALFDKEAYGDPQEYVAKQYVTKLRDRIRAAIARAEKWAA